MRFKEPEEIEFRHSVVDPAQHSLYECHHAIEFSTCFERATGHSVEYVVDQVVISPAVRATYVTGSIPLGMATNGSDVDFVVLVDSKEALLTHGDKKIANTNQRLQFSNDSDALRVGTYMTMMRGITVEVAAVITSSIKRIYSRLQSRGPDLSESEIMTLGRLSTGWLLSESDGYLENSGVDFSNPALAIYCSTRSFTFAIIYRLKAVRALDLGDIPQALHLGRLSVEMAYSAYFSSEGLTYLGAKWLAQIGHARGAAERVGRHPLLKEGVPLLFPTLKTDRREAILYIQDTSKFLKSMRNLIEQKTLFRIAFNACPQIGSAV